LGALARLLPDLVEFPSNSRTESGKVTRQRGANVNQKDDIGKTPLAIALEYKRDDVAKLLRD
jgi:ankyrin repeat protein